MARRLKGKKDNVVLGKERKCRNDVSFSFVYCTSNNKYKLDRHKGTNEHIEYIDALHEKLLEISNCGWMEFSLRRKTNGYETIPFHQLKFLPSKKSHSEDSKFTSIRFGKQQKYRLIGYKRPDCDIFDIYGIDYDYSAYNHGK